MVHAGLEGLDVGQFRNAKEGWNDEHQEKRGRQRAKGKERGGKARRLTNDHGRRGRDAWDVHVRPLCRTNLTGKMLMFLVLSR